MSRNAGEISRCALLNAAEETVAQKGISGKLGE